MSLWKFGHQGALCLCRAAPPISSSLVWRDPRHIKLSRQLENTRKFSSLIFVDTRYKLNQQKQSHYAPICPVIPNRTFTAATDETKAVFLKAKYFGDKLAFVSQHGRYTYKDLCHYSLKLADEIQNCVKISNKTGAADTVNPELPLLGERVAFLCENDMSYLVTQWAIWMNGGIAIPLCKSHPESELEYFVSDSQSCLIVTTDDYEGKVLGISKDLGIPLKTLTADDFGGDYNEADDPWTSHSGVNRFDVLSEYMNHDGYREMKAMIIYTSGTTGRPKGVVYTHGNLYAQMAGMIEAWKWTSDDVILHVLPLHHVHGVVNVLATPLFCGATCVMVPKFDAFSTWKMLLTDTVQPSINVFMAVPTIYAKLIEEYETNKSDPIFVNMKDVLSKKIRLMVSGSAALPQPIMEKWAEITGHTLLERYGMTEIGMALTNPLEGDRQPGAVGKPFPGVSVCIVDHHDDGYDVIATADSQELTVQPGKEQEQGELLVKGDNVFREYWNKEGATQESFTQDGWFKTGDTAVYKDGAFRIVGRTSVDVLKSGGYKISALDIERHLLSHPDIRDVAVVGLPDDMWGQRIAAVVVLKADQSLNLADLKSYAKLLLDMSKILPFEKGLPDEMWGQRIAAVVVLKADQSLNLSDLKSWATDKMPPYHVPTVLKCLDVMPRNAMGKVNKKQLVKDVFPEYFK